MWYNFANKIKSDFKILPSGDKMEKELEELKERNKNLELTNKKLKDEKTADRAKYEGVDVQEFLELKKQNSDLESQIREFEKSNGILKQDFEKQGVLLANNKDSLNSLVIDGGITSVLTELEKHKLNDGALPLAIMSIKSKGITLNDENKAFIGDKSLSDYIKDDWLQDTSSKNLVTANSNYSQPPNGGNGSTPPPQTQEVKGVKEAQQKGDVAGVFKAHLANIEQG